MWNFIYKFIFYIYRYYFSIFTFEASTNIYKRERKSREGIMMCRARIMENIDMMRRADMHMDCLVVVVVVAEVWTPWEGKKKKKSLS